MDFGDLIPVAGIMAAVAFSWIGVKHRELKLANRRITIEAERESAEKKRLEERLAVLERIVTDRGIQTADQIDALLERDTTTERTS